MSQGGTLNNKNDFAGYVPISGSSENGFLGINSETAPGAVSILDIHFNGATQLWQTSASTGIDFSGVVATVANCSGTVTPWNTIISCEEITSAEIENDPRFPFPIPRDLNGDGYDDMGWAVEINPETKTVIDKLWALGNFKHENAVIHGNERTLYQGADATVGYLYKFVADNPRDLSSGKLYVYSGSKSGTGNWIQINNATKAERNSTVAQSAAVGGTVFIGIEDVEIGPDGWIYFAVKGEDRVYRFQDPDPISGTTVPQMETFVGNASYSISHANGTTDVNWSNGNDNLAFDGEGNLWVLQDGGSQNYIWVVEKGHTQSSPKVRIFGNAPSGAEPTGITFSPNYRFLFMSIQHPASNNNSSQVDAAGNAVTFNKGTTLVLARKEHLGISAQVWYLDADGDQYATTPTVTSATSPGPGYSTTILPTTDCDDSDAAIHPETIWYLDADGDGFADPTTTQNCTSPGAGYTTTVLPTTDCDDNDPTVNQASTWYLDADGDGFADPSTLEQCGSPGTGYTTDVLPTTDCDDSDPLVQQASTWYLDADGDGFADPSTLEQCGSPGTGYTTTVLPTTDCDDSDPTVNQASTWYLDADGDGFADPSTLEQCGSPGTGYTTTVLPTTDCDDSDPLVQQASTWYLDADGDGFADPNTLEQCGSPGTGYTTTVLPTTDCDDNDPMVNQVSTWYLDADGDGFADTEPVTSCTSPGEHYTTDMLPPPMEMEERTVFYPNPTGALFNIHFGKVYDEAIVSVVNALNQVILTERFVNSHSVRIDLGDYSSGVYFIKITSRGNDLEHIKVVRK